jgi:hypothetical protein
MAQAEIRALRSAMSVTWGGDFIADLDFIAARIQRSMEEIPREEDEDFSRLGGPWGSYKRTLVDILAMLEKGKYLAAKDMVDVFRSAPDDDAEDR